jgi:hypothetical protein
MILTLLIDGYKDTARESGCVLLFFNCPKSVAGLRLRAREHSLLFRTHLGLTSHLNMDNPEMHISENHSVGDAPVTWDSLDDSALIEIFRRLGAGSLATLQQVDSRCRRLASEDMCWRQVHGHTSNPAAVPSQPLNPQDPLCSLVLYAGTP